MTYYLIVSGEFQGIVLDPLEYLIMASTASLTEKGPVRTATFLNQSEVAAFDEYFTKIGLPVQAIHGLLFKIPTGATPLFIPRLFQKLKKCTPSPIHSYAVECNMVLSETPNYVELVAMQVFYKSDFE